MEEDTLSSLEEIVQMSEQIHDFVEGGIPLRELLGFSDRVMEEKYRLAYEAYQKGEYEEAIARFSYLVSIDSFQASYWLALAHSQWKQGDFLGACNSYSSLTALDDQNPRHYFYLAHCHFRCHQIGEGIEAIERGIEMAGQDHQYREIEEWGRKMLLKFEENPIFDQFSLEK